LYDSDESDDELPCTSARLLVHRLQRSRETAPAKQPIAAASDSPTNKGEQQNKGAATPATQAKKQKQKQRQKYSRSEERGAAATPTTMKNEKLHAVQPEPEPEPEPEPQPQSRHHLKLQPEAEPQPHFNRLADTTAEQRAICCLHDAIVPIDHVYVYQALHLIVSFGLL
jgi:hypothetical protein